jgi:hypothetical protein
MIEVTAAHRANQERFAQKRFRKSRKGAAEQNKRG